jgi:hypothetical protein
MRLAGHWFRKKTPARFVVLSVVVLSAIAVPSHLTPQANPANQTASERILPPPIPAFRQPVSCWKLLSVNIAEDQKRIWLFPAKVNKKTNWIPTVTILGTTAALIALDSRDSPYFRRTSSFDGFHNVFIGNATTVGTVLAPASFYVAGWARKDPKMQEMALLVGEAVADTQILAGSEGYH